MSRFLSEKFKDLVPYVPGEQPRGDRYIKLNTNESPYPPSPKAVLAASEAAAGLRLYPDLLCLKVTELIADKLGVDKDMIVCANGSDEIINFAVTAFCDADTPLVCPGLSYGFYPVIAGFNRVPLRKIPLRPDHSIDPSDYCGAGGTVLIANPNAPTGIALGVDDIRGIVENNPDDLVIIDEAYVDFGAESCAGLLNEYDNLMVIQTFSKSRSLAGGRFGFAAANREIIADMNVIRYSTNPYNVNSMTLAVAAAEFADGEYTRQCCEKIKKTREYTAAELKKFGFELTDSVANFVFAKHPKISGEDLYLALKAKNILIRHFADPKISEYNRISIGTDEQMAAFIAAVKEVLDERLA